jgi:flagellar motor switch protein FliN/FliY
MSAPDGKPAAVDPALEPGRTAGDASLPSLLGDVPLELSVELGRVKLSLREIAGRLGPGSIIPLGKATGDKLEIRINEHLVARGEAVAVGDRYGVRIVEIIGDGKAS